MQHLSSTACLVMCLLQAPAFGACIEGHVLDVNGNPVADATVGATAMAPDSPDGGSVKRHFMTTRSDGAFAFSDLGPIEYALTATTTANGSAAAVIPIQAAAHGCIKATLNADVEGTLVSGLVDAPEDANAVSRAMIFVPLAAPDSRRYYALIRKNRYAILLPMGKYFAGAIGTGLRSLPRVVVVGESGTQASFVMHRDPPSDEALRRQILAMRDADQAVRELVKGPDDVAAQARVAIVDRANSHALEQILSRIRWPTADRVGFDGVEACWMLLQHSAAGQIQQWLPALKLAFQRGELGADKWALSVDRARVQQGLPQIYGTQAEAFRDHHFAGLRPIEDAAHVDERRASLGLEPLDEYVKELKETYGL